MVCEEQIEGEDAHPYASEKRIQNRERKAQAAWILREFRLEKNEQPLNGAARAAATNE